MILLFLTALLALAPPALAQNPVLRLQGTGEPETVALHTGHGFPAAPARALRAIGADVDEGPTGARVLLFGDSLTFEVGSPFFRAGRGHAQLVAEPYRAGGVLHLPHQFFAEWLPARYARQLAFADGVLRLRDPAAATRVAAPAPPARVVILDAGHGGPDPGRIGPNRLREKDVTLSIVRRLGAILAERGYEVHYTRTTDTLIALADRPRLANQWKAGRPSALFLSIHANAGPAKATGFETFFLSDARTEDERRVAEMENAAVEYERNGNAADIPEIDQIFNSLRNDFYIHASNDLAEAIQDRLAAFHPGPNRGVKQAGFRVLVGAFMPAVLIEVAFISNPGEARLLGTSAFQQKIARAIADAVDRFFDGHEHLWDVPETAVP